jgi:hypothetical protein
MKVLKDMELITMVLKKPQNLFWYVAADPPPPPRQSKYQSNNLVQIAGYFMKTGTGGCLILKIFKKASSFDFQNFARKNWNQKFF